MNFTDAKNLLFMSSSGHCSLDCDYCVASPVVKMESSLDYQDIAFILNKLPGKVGLIFSGKGDFFAGYRKHDQLLSRVLDHDVDVVLDINGIMIHEFSQITHEKIAKVKYINLTMHYSQLLRKNSLKIWARNAITLIEKQKCVDFIVGFILTPKELGLWGEALNFYAGEVFEKTGKKLVLIRDVLTPFGDDEENAYSLLCSKYDGVIESTRSEDFASLFRQYTYVVCPAGKSYFRVWNDGLIQGCPHIGELENLGNLKDREFHPRPSNIKCSIPRFCDCNRIAQANLMEYSESFSS